MINIFLDSSPVTLLADDARALDNGLDVSETSRHQEIAEGFFLKFGAFLADEADADDANDTYPSNQNLKHLPHPSTSPLPTSSLPTPLLTTLHLSHAVVIQFSLQIEIQLSLQIVIQLSLQIR